MIALLSLALSLRAAEPAWVDRHLECYGGINRELPLPSLRVTNFVSDDPAFARAWGELMAVPGVENNRAGLFLLGNGRTYFIEMPSPAGSEPTTRDFYERLFTTGNEYAFTARFHDGRPDVRFFVTLAATQVRVEITAASRFDFGFARLDAEPTFAPDLEAQSADVLIRVLAFHAIHAGDLDRLGRAAVRRCLKRLDLTDIYDRRIENHSRRLLPRD